VAAVFVENAAAINKAMTDKQDELEANVAKLEAEKKTTLNLQARVEELEAELVGARAGRVQLTPANMAYADREGMSHAAMLFVAEGVDLLERLRARWTEELDISEHRLDEETEVEHAARRFAVPLPFPSHSPHHSHSSLRRWTLMNNYKKHFYQYMDKASDIDYNVVKGHVRRLETECERLERLAAAFVENAAAINKAMTDKQDELESNVAKLAAEKKTTLAL
jgi:hypothetical protein